MLVAASAAPRSTRARRTLTLALHSAAAPYDVDVDFPSIGCALGVDDPFVRLRFAGRAGGPAVLVLGGISADRRVSDADDGDGWWRTLVAAKGGVDLNSFQVIGADFFPLNPATTLNLSPTDYADVYVAALQRAGVGQLHAVVGGSFGGMIALALARRHPLFVGKIAILCASHKPSPLGFALRRIQRDIIALAEQSGDGRAGVALARRLAMTTYRTQSEFQSRFADGAALDAYLSARGRDYAARMTPSRYMTLSAAIDAHDETPEAIETPALIVAATSDQIVPIADCRALAERLAGPAQILEVETPFGHDAFLKESARFAPALAAFLKETLA